MIIKLKLEYNLYKKNIIHWQNILENNIINLLR